MDIFILSQTTQPDKDRDHVPEQASTSTSSTNLTNCSFTMTLKDALKGQKIMEEQLQTMREEVQKKFNQLKDGSNGEDCPIRIAVLDTGIYAEHPWCKEFVYLSESVVDQGNPTQDIMNHATPIAGILYKSLGQYLTPNFLKILNVHIKMDTSQYLSSLRDGLQRVMNRKTHNHETFDIILICSGVMRDCPIGGVPSEINRLLDQLSADSTIICAASNEGMTTESPLAHGNKGDIAYPASHPNVISIGVSNECGDRFNCSPVGERLDFISPGVEIKTASRPPTELTQNEIDDLVTKEMLKQGGNRNVKFEDKISKQLIEDIAGRVWTFYYSYENYSWMTTCTGSSFAAPNFACAVGNVLAYTHITCGLEYRKAITPTKHIIELFKLVSYPWNQKDGRKFPEFKLLSQQKIKNFVDENLI